jgi:hypothetical protein
MPLPAPRAGLCWPGEFGLADRGCVAHRGFGCDGTAVGKFRRRKFNFHRDTHCGCAPPSQSTTHQSIIFHARKGERPQVIVKKK